MGYSKQKEDRRFVAEKHTRDMADKYSAEIAECIRASILYGGPDRKPIRAGEKSAQISFL